MTTKTLLARASLAALSVILPGTSGAFAQDAAVAADGPGPRRVIENVIVQAQKRSETVQTVPIAMTAFSGDELERKFAKDIADFSGSTPNVQLAPEGISPFASSFFMRGLGTDERESFSDPSVAVVVDGVTEARASVALTDLLDIESVEVLRGPQGTLQGRNATAGAILVRRAAPDVSEFQAMGGMLAGNYGRLEAKGMVNVPLVDGVAAFRLAVKSSTSDGFYENRFSNEKVGGQDRITLLPSFKYVTDNFDMVLRGEFVRVRGDSSTLLAYNTCRVDPTLMASSGGANDAMVDILAQQFGGDVAAASCAREPDKESYAINQNRPQGEFNDLDVWGITGEMNYTLPDIGTITYIGNYRHTDEHSTLDPDGTVGSLFSSNDFTSHYQTSHELRFASEFSDFVDFVAGVLYLRQAYDLDRTQFLGFVAPPAQIEFNMGSAQRNEQWGLFAQANWHLTDRLALVTGARYSADKKRMDICAAAPGDCAGRIETLDESWTNVSPRIGLNYQLADTLFAYGYWARGFRAGGFNGNASSAALAGPYDPERVDTYEVGFKWDGFDNMLRVNGAAFWMEAKGLQRSISKQSPSGSVDVITDNAASARLRGLELEVTALPFRGFSLSGSVGYLDAKYTDYCEDLNGATPNDPSLLPCGPAVGLTQPVDLTGLPLNRAPKWNARLAGTYDFPVGDAGTLSLNAEWIYESSQLTTQAGFPTGTVNGITNYNGVVVSPLRGPSNIVNASITWYDADDRYRVAVFGKNLTNEIYILRTSTISGVWNFAMLNAPRTYGIELTYNF